MPDRLKLLSTLIATFMPGLRVMTFLHVLIHVIWSSAPHFSSYLSILARLTALMTCQAYIFAIWVQT